jgi:hypothetical protein
MVRSHGTFLRCSISSRQSKFGSTTTHFGTNCALSRSSKRKIVLRLHLIAEHRGIPLQIAEVRACIRVEQQLVGIKAVAVLGA